MTRVDVTIRRMEPGEEVKVCALARAVFHEFVAPRYERAGLDEFLRYVDPGSLAKRSSRDHFILLAEHVGNLVGIIEMRCCRHISLLFVAGEVQRQGVATQLLHAAIEICRSNAPNLSEISVHASPNAVAAYARLGFQAEGAEQLEHGIQYIPMKLRL